jgi:hypothetical protein
MSNIDYDEIGVPCTADDAIAENIERIRYFQREGEGYASTSQKIMIGLALCRPDLLEQARYPNAEVKSAWERLDDPQREAIIRWWKD